MASSREPIFNVPAIVVATLVVLGLVHVTRTYLLSPRDDVQFLLWFSFIPARYDAGLLTQGGVPGGWGAEIWTFVTYAFIHANFMHLALNSIWLLAFGSAVARRFGVLRFVTFFIVTSAAGAGAHLLTNAGDYYPVVGASAAISGFMAAAIRFVFQRGGPLGVLGAGGRRAYRAPASPLLVTLRDPRVLAFLAVWFGLNVLFGVGLVSLTGDQQSVAWQAHIGGFLAGLLLFPLFDPVTPLGPEGQPERESSLH